MRSPGPAGHPRGQELYCRFTIDDLRQVRRAAEQWARRAGLGPERVADFVLALNEITTNAVRHGSPAAALRLYSGGRGGVVAEVSDRGRWLPQASPDRAGGQRGLPLAGRLCDQVTICPGRDGTTVTLRMSRAADPPTRPSPGPPGCWPAGQPAG